MAQATGYTREDLREPLQHLQAVHEQMAANVSAFIREGQWDKWAVLRYKLSQARFLNVLRVPPFSPHQGGSVFSPATAQSSSRTRVASSPLAPPAYNLAYQQQPSADAPAQPVAGAAAWNAVANNDDDDDNAGGGDDGNALDEGGGGGGVAGQAVAQVQL